MTQRDAILAAKESDPRVGQCKTLGEARSSGLGKGAIIIFADDTTAIISSCRHEPVEKGDVEIVIEYTYRGQNKTCRTSPGIPGVLFANGTWVGTYETGWVIVRPTQDEGKSIEGSSNDR